MQTPGLPNFTITHEFGHAMGLALDPNPFNLDPRGLTGHSSDPENVMGSGMKEITEPDGKKKTVQGNRTKVNQDQCTVVRNHQFKLGQTTEEACHCHPPAQTP